jgi:uncharacterized protein RhaS with RHS repeats
MLGRFLSPDPIGIAGGINLYGYVGNDPLNLVDRVGLGAGPSAPNGYGNSWTFSRGKEQGRGKGNGGFGGQWEPVFGSGPSADEVGTYSNVMSAGIFDQGAMDEVAAAALQNMAIDAYLSQTGSGYDASPGIATFATGLTLVIVGTAMVVEAPATAMLAAFITAPLGPFVAAVGTFAGVAVAATEVLMGFGLIDEGGAMMQAGLAVPEAPSP